MQNNQYNNNNKTIITSNDSINIRDNINHRLQGFVTIYERRKHSNFLKLLGKHNLILYCGREWLLQRAVNKAIISGTEDPSLFIAWFSVGTGGATTTSPFTPIDPELTDTSLANEIIINASDTALADGGRKHPFDTITFSQDPNNNDKYLIAEIDTTLGYDDANGYYLNEAGLVISNSNDPTIASIFKLFARCTFSTIEKDNTRELLFRWKLYF